MIWQHGVEHKGCRSNVKKTYHKLEKQRARTRQRNLYPLDGKNMSVRGGRASAKGEGRSQGAAEGDEIADILRPSKVRKDRVRGEEKGWCGDQTGAEEERYLVERHDTPHLPAVQSKSGKETISDRPAGDGGGSKVEADGIAYKGDHADLGVGEPYAYLMSRIHVVKGENYIIHRRDQ